MAKRLPLDSSYAERPVRTKLDGVFYWLRLTWNPRESIWTLSISDADDNPLAHGLALRVETPLLGRTLRGLEGFPSGDIVPIDTSGQQTDPGRDDIGERVRLIYVTAAEVASAG